ncbi:MAG: HEAT repeat domain-containing protein [Candidatus Heimdallarchaeota archaeon]|nr:HEAT repeat domain-containing protein [Candidatus Heimdallarchaeota archaeon]
MANINKLIKQLSDDDPAKREEAILALGELRDMRAVEALIKVVSQDNTENRTYAIKSLSEIGDHRAIETLIFCLMDTEENIRLSAARGLGKFSSPQAISSLLISLRKDPKISIKSRVALSLGSIGSELAVEDLLKEAKLEHPASLLYSIDSALKMIAKNNGFETVEELVHSVIDKKSKLKEQTPESEQDREKEEIVNFPNLWPYIRKYVVEQLEGIQTILSVESNVKSAEKKIADILGEKFWKFTEFMSSKMGLKFSEYQSTLLWQMAWDTSKPIRSEIFQMIKDQKIEEAELDKHQAWLDEIEEEKDKKEEIAGEAIMEIDGVIFDIPIPDEVETVSDEIAETLKDRPVSPSPYRPPIRASTPKDVAEKSSGAELARSISGDIEQIMKKYSNWKGEIEEEDELAKFWVDSE